MSYYANQGQGYRAAAIMIEDFFPGSDVVWDCSFFVVDTMRSCSVNPTYVHPTPLVFGVMNDHRYFLLALYCKSFMLLSLYMSE